ncbi:hypothetical protein [Rubrivirga sp. IMCC43871]|uniref:hypothetical protein n=1 Tax=Rubrivirga sp. IMCC43871 TaxID=3391575 RepID=UPI00398FFA28
MGHRANYALRQGGDVTFGKNRWGALGIPDLLFGGFERVADYVRSSQVEGADRLYDNTDCEGCVLVDADERVVLFDGISELLEESPLRQIAIAALRQDWPGWALRHAQRGILDVGEHLALDADTMRRLGSDGPLYHNVDEEDVVDPKYPQNRGSARTEVIVAGPDRTSSYLSEHAATALLAYGPRMTVLLEAAPAAAIGLGQKLHAVIEVAHHSQTLALWQDVPEYRALERVRSSWPSWKVRAADARAAGAISQHPTALSLSETEALAAVERFASRSGQERAGEMGERALAALSEIRRARAG